MRRRLDSLEEGISPTESLISQDTFDFIFQRFNSSNTNFMFDKENQLNYSEKQEDCERNHLTSGSISNLRDTSKSLNNRLEALPYIDQNLNSPISSTEERICEEMSTESTSTHSTVRLEKLSAFVDSIGSWEDELLIRRNGDAEKQDTSPLKSTPLKKYPAPLPPQIPPNIPPQTHRKIIQEDGDFIRRPSVKKVRAPDIPPKLPPRECHQEKKENLPIAAKSPVKGSKDPAEMSLKERLALFERNRRATKSALDSCEKPPLPKKPENISSGGIRDKIATLFSSSNNEERNKDIECVLNRHGIRKPSHENAIESVMRPLLPPPAPPSVISPGKRKSGEAECIEMVPIVEEPKRSKTNQKQEHLMELQVNNLERSLNPPPKPNQGEVRTTGGATTAYPRRAISFDEDSSFMSTEEEFYCENMQKECKANGTQSVLKSLLESSYGFADNYSDSSASNLSEDDDEGIYEKRDRGSISSDSFLYRRSPIKSKIPEIREEDLEESSSEDASVLLHSVSFYRKQQKGSQMNQQKATTSKYQDSFPPLLEMNGQQSQFDENEKLMQEKIKKLKGEIHKEQQIISQTSRALNLCAATVEFSGSTEAVEGERHLLVATHRRLGALNELQRINVEKSLHPRDSPPERGSIRVTGITLPLAQNYIREMATNTIPGHHLLCLLKYNEHVLATQTIVTLPGLVAVKFADELTLPEVYEDFKVTFEVYGMAAQREVLPHELKYHILGKKIPTSGKKFIGGTPLKRLRKPMVESPAGPLAVRTPAFIPYGYVVFTMKESQRRSTWALNRSTMLPDPLEGVVHMKISCQLERTLEYRGFLTMFNDVSGFGAWHRRWCLLSGTTLTYWKYPDDEGKCEPIGWIDLKMCGATRIGPVPRDICARLNTLLLEIERPRKEADKESLVLICRGNRTIVRHLLSTDTRDDREEWCRNLNHILTLIKCWGSPK
ncbi:anillin-like isoform X2 [Lutzomyia longipalpis]|nr:anillin-like isoform X2 [Lutzomyia longipalpis]